MICKQEHGEDGTFAQASVPRAHSSGGPRVGHTNHGNDPEQPASERAGRQAMRLANFTRGHNEATEGVIRSFCNYNDSI